MRNWRLGGGQGRHGAFPAGHHRGSVFEMGGCGWQGCSGARATKEWAMPCTHELYMALAQERRDKLERRARSSVAFPVRLRPYRCPTYKTGSAGDAET